MNNQVKYRFVIDLSSLDRSLPIKEVGLFEKTDYR